MESQQQVKTIDLSKMSEEDALGLLWRAVNKATGKGVYNIDECYTLKMAFHKLNQYLEENDMEKVD